MMIVYLEIGSFQGFGGWHYYADLRTIEPDRCQIDLEYTIDVHQAAKFNKDEPGAFKAYHPGDKSRRFESLDQVYREARRQWRDLFPGATLLLEGSPASYGPKPIIDGNDKLAEQLNPWAEECDRIGWYGHGKKNDRRLDELTEMWHNAMEETGYTNFR